MDRIVALRAYESLTGPQRTAHGATSRTVAAPIGAWLAQGKEMADHARFSVDTGVTVYFCDPRSLWQRGSNENTNGLLRQ